MNFILARFLVNTTESRLSNNRQKKKSVKFGNLHLWQTWQFGWIVELSTYLHSNYKFLSSIRGLYLILINLPENFWSKEPYVSVVVAAMWGTIL